MGDLVLVTGGTGYIATYCIKLLLEKGFSVRTTVRSAESPKVQVLRDGCGVEGQAGNIEILEADLSKESGWAEACAGCKYVLHTASPVGDFQVKGLSEEDAQPLIDAAIAGTKNLMNGVVASGTCKRVVVTSSVATISPTTNPLFAEYPRTAGTYSDPEKADYYSKSKILAEQAAWDIAKENGLELATIMPSYVVGPCLSALNRSASLKKFDGWFLPDKKPRPTYAVCDTPMVDVRDVALAHVEAMLREQAANKRFIVDHVAILPHDVLEEWRAAGYKHVPKEARTPVLNATISALSNCSSSAKKVKRFVNNRLEIFDSTDSKEILGIEYIPVKQTALDYAKSCEEFSLLKPELHIAKA